jgi:hypothetical protein
MSRDDYGTAWYADGPDAARVNVDPEQEFGRDWIGHADDEELTD